MKKRIISIILVMVWFLTLTACAQETPSENHAKVPELPAIETIEVDDPLDTPKPFTTLPTQETESFESLTIEDGIETLDSDKIAAMSLEEVEALMELLVNMSKDADLSDDASSEWKLYYVALTFNDIWYQCPEYDKVKFEKEFCEAFDNVYEQAVEAGLAFDYLAEWIRTPIPKVISKYLSSDNFKNPTYISCDTTISELSDEGIAMVANAFVNNPAMETNARIARSIICNTNDDKIAEMAWEHIVKLSKSAAVAELDSDDCTYILKHIFSNKNTIYKDSAVIKQVYNTEYITQIAENILKNPSFDLSAKYVFFCSDFFPNSDVEVEISRMAMHTLYDVLSVAPTEECIQIGKILADVYYGESDTPMEDISTELHETYICLLNYCFERLTY